MADPLIVTTLRAKRDEIAKRIDDLNVQLAEARSDLLHIVATLSMFDPADRSTRPAQGYQAATKAMPRSDMLSLCKAALSASEAALSTRDLARYVIAAEGWNTEDRRLQMTISHRVSGLMTRFARRGVIHREGMRDRVALWRLP